MNLTKTLIALALLAPLCAQAQITFDAAGSGAGAEPLNVSVAGGTPAAVVGCAYSNDTDGPSLTATYDSESMTRIASFDFTNSGGGYISVFLLASGANAGTVNFTITGGASSVAGYAVSLNAGTTLELNNTATFDMATATSPSGGTLTLGGTTSYVIQCGQTDGADATAQAPVSGWTGVYEQDIGSQVNVGDRYGTIGSSDVTWGWTMTSSIDVAGIAIAVNEVSGGSSIAAIANYYRRQK